MSQKQNDVKLSIIADVWRRTTGRPVDTPSTQYILESISVELECNGLPQSPESCLQSFESLVSCAEGVDAEDVSDFCQALFVALLDVEKEETEDVLLPGECEICERRMPLTRHHLIPRTMHGRLRKQGYDRALLNQTANLCRLCHTAVHRFYTEKELAMNFNTVEKLMQVPKLWTAIPLCFYRAKILPVMPSGPIRCRSVLDVFSSHRPGQSCRHLRFECQE